MNPHPATEGIDRLTGPDGTEMFLCALEGQGAEKREDAAAILDEAEKARGARFHFVRDQDRFIRSRAFLRRVLGQTAGIPPDALKFGSTGHGKPCLAGGPDFNLSHSGGYAVLALSQTGPVGVDIETEDRRIDPLALGQVCFTAAEYRVLEKLDDVSRRRRFLAFWTAKEARMKLTGEGLSLPPRSIVLYLRDGWPVGYMAPTHPAARLYKIDLPVPDLLCSLALPGSGHEGKPG